MKSEKIRIKPTIFIICATDRLNNTLLCVGPQSEKDKTLNPTHLSQENVYYWCGTRKNAESYLNKIAPKVKSINPSIELSIKALNRQSCPIIIEKSSMTTMHDTINNAKYQLK